MRPSIRSTRPSPRIESVPVRAMPSSDGAATVIDCELDRIGAGFTFDHDRADDTSPPDAYFRRERKAARMS